LEDFVVWVGFLEVFDLPLEVARRFLVLGADSGVDGAVALLALGVLVLFFLCEVEELSDILVLVESFVTGSWESYAADDVLVGPVAQGACGYAVPCLQLSS
jgi:hypothetical protein